MTHSHRGEIADPYRGGADNRRQFHRKLYINYTGCILIFRKNSFIINNL